MATNFLTIGPTELKSLLSQSATFQSVVGAANAAAALAFIHKHYAEPSDPLPRAIVGWPDDVTLTKATSSNFRMNGSPFLMFEFKVPAMHQGDREAGDDWFLEQTGEILKELLQLVLAGGSLNAVSAEADVIVRMFDRDLTTIGDGDATDITKASDARWGLWLIHIQGVAFGAA